MNQRLAGGDAGRWRTQRVELRRDLAKASYLNDSVSLRCGNGLI
jgi:hypothetical protein